MKIYNYGMNKREDIGKLEKLAVKHPGIKKYTDRMIKEYRSSLNGKLENSRGICLSSYMRMDDESAHIISKAIFIEDHEAAKNRMLKRFGRRM